MTQTKTPPKNPGGFIVGAEEEMILHGQQEIQQISVSDYHAFRAPGRARCEDHIGR